MAAADGEPRPRSRSRWIALAACIVLAFAGLVSLGTWQLYRLQWKLALIERVTQRVHAAPVSAPGPAEWARISPEADEYRHVRVTGIFLPDRTTRVQASTELGTGYWLLTPLRVADGSVVLVNRGFVPSGSSPSEDNAGLDNGSSTVTGLLRMTEPGGGFLRRNDPTTNHWYSRDVQAIAAVRGLVQVAPYFLDADAAPDTASASGRPVAGLTVVSFHNNHLIYALTWYALALMAAAAGWWIAREERRAALRRRTSRDGSDRDSADDEQHNHP